MTNCIENKNIRAFTLVEIAMVLLIIGILLAGMMMGQKMIEQARVVGTIKQINSYKIAVESFVSVYKQLPGDLENAHLIIPGCTQACDTSAGGVHAGDGSIAFEDWDFYTYQSECLGNARPSSSTEARNAESMLFWYELKQVDLITGVTEECIIGPAFYKGDPTFGGGLPEAKIGGGFWMGTNNTVITDSSVLGRPSEYPILGNVLVMVSQPNPSNYYTAYVPNNQAQQALLPRIAAQIDRKIDDGRPDNGKIHAYGHLASCYMGGDKYKEIVDTKDCGLIISIGY